MNILASCKNPTIITTVCSCIHLQMYMTYATHACMTSVLCTFCMELGVYDNFVPFKV